MIATVKHRSWLRRVLELSVGEATYEVEYYGRGLGYEMVKVNGTRVAGGRSVAWFLPRFAFEVGGQAAVIEVKVRPWLTIGAFRLIVGGVKVYEE